MKKGEPDVYYRSFDHLFLYITRRCNFECAYCYMGTPRQEDMSLEMVQQVADFFAAIGTRFVTVLGGEPTLHPDFIEILRILKSTGLQIAIDTNGSFTPELLAQIDPSSIAWFLFSLDSSSRRSHNLLRPNRYNIVIRNVQLAVELGFTVGLITTLSLANLSEVKRMPRFAKEAGVQFVNFHRMMPQGRGCTRANLLISPPEWINVCLEIEEATVAAAIDILYPPVFVPPSEIKHFLHMGYQGCTARSADIISMFPDGTVNLCLLFMDRDQDFGRFENGQMSINRSLTNELSYEFSTARQCDSCSATQNASFCQGGCQRYFEIVRQLGLGEVCCNDYVIICPFWKVRAGQRLEHSHASPNGHVTVSASHVPPNGSRCH